MPRAERDHVMTRLRPAERDQFRRLIQDMRTQAAASSGHRRMARQGLAAHSSTVSPALRVALEAVVARDAMEPQVDTCPSDCALKQLGTATRVRLSSGGSSQSASFLAAIRDPPSGPRSGTWRTSLVATVTLSQASSSPSRRRTLRMAGRSRGMWPEGSCSRSTSVTRNVRPRRLHAA
jgi:hypothetical protein